MTAMAAARGESSGGLAMLDVIVLVAMAITAAAFAVGLILHSGVAQIPALIAAAALYMVMAASYLMVARPARSGGGSDRMNDLEAALEVIDKDLQRIDKVEDDVSRLDLIADRVDRLDQAMSDHGLGDRNASSGRFAQITQDVEEVHAKIENLRADLEGEARIQRDKITSDLRSLEGLIKQLSHDLVAASVEAPTTEEETAASAAPVAFAEIRKIEIAVDEDDAEADESEDLAGEETISIVEVEETEERVLSADEPAIGFLGETERRDAEARAPEARAPEADLPEAADIAGIGDSEMLEIVSQAIEAGRVDLYLQPTVTLPERRARYFEACTRIRTKTESLIRPRSYLPAAESSGMMPLIDNVLLVKSVQTLRRLGSASRIKGVFCNVSISTLLDPEFFPELVEFMEENSGLSESLIFEVSQQAIAGLGDTEFGALETLAALGYGFSLDHVADFDLDFISLRDRSFRFVKTDAPTFLGGSSRSGRFSAGDLKRALDDLDIKLIVEKVADEDTVARLLERGIALAQGDLFGKPRPMSPALVREIAGANAA
jgi:cyclic-di-GMP phosphodiesterase TipF (flagellum assembly factor)